MQENLWCKRAKDQHHCTKYCNICKELLQRSTKQSSKIVDQYLIVFGILVFFIIYW